MKNHNNLSDELKSILGWYANYQLSAESIIFDFEQRKYKDYEKLTNDLAYIYRKRDEHKAFITNLFNDGKIEQSTIDLLNEGIFTGLVNHNRLSFTAYYK